MDDKVKIFPDEDGNSVSRFTVSNTVVIENGSIPLNAVEHGEQTGSSSLGIYINEYSLSEIDSYLSSDLRNEMGGVMLGNVFKDITGVNFIVINDFVIARHTNSSVSRLTFTHESWEQIHRDIETYHKDKIILGWFHSHPGHSVFMSSYDIFIQENFFNLDFMVAYVFDSVIKTRGFFYNRSGKVEEAGSYFTFRSESPQIPAAWNTEEPDKGKKKFRMFIPLVLFLFFVNIFISVYLISRYVVINKNVSSLYGLEEKITGMQNEIKNLKKQSDSVNLRDTLVSDYNAKKVLRYVVREGDDLKKISALYFSDSNKFPAIMKQNSLSGESDIFPGRIIEIPVE